MTDSQGALQAMLEQAAHQLEQGAFEDAVQGFTACLLVAPEESTAFRGRATARFQLKDWAGAEADFERAKELNPHEPENCIGYGMSLAMQLKIYPAIEVLEAAIARWPDMVRGYIQLGLLQFKLCAIAKGKELFQEALKRHPTLPERRFIEETLNEQKSLDKNRYYRPDFEALRKRKNP